MSGSFSIVNTEFWPISQLQFLELIFIASHLAFIWIMQVKPLFKYMQSKVFDSCGCGELFNVYEQLKIVVLSYSNSIWLLLIFDLLIFEQGGEGGLWIWNVISKCHAIVSATSWFLVLSSADHILCRILLAFRFSAIDFRIWAGYVISGWPDETLRLTSCALSCVIVVNWVTTLCIKEGNFH